MVQGAAFDEVLALAERARRRGRCARARRHGGRDLSISTSVGVAELGTSVPTVTALIAEADAALYEPSTPARTACGSAPRPTTPRCAARMSARSGRLAGLVRSPWPPPPLPPGRSMRPHRQGEGGRRPGAERQLLGERPHGRRHPAPQPAISPSAGGEALRREHRGGLQGHEPEARPVLIGDLETSWPTGATLLRGKLSRDVVGCAAVVRARAAGRLRHRRHAQAAHAEAPRRSAGLSVRAEPQSPIERR